MHYYSHHIGDFIRDTSRLTDSQAMAYLRLIWLYYESEQPLPNNPELLAFKIGSDVKTVEMLLQCYFYANALHWHHKRIDAEIEVFKIKSKKAAESAKARWNNARDMRTHSDCNASAMLTKIQDPITKIQDPITNSQEKEKKQPQAKPARFDPLAIELPECIKPEAWSDWIAYRRSRKLTITEPTMIAQLKKLEGWWHDGHDPNAIIGTSIAQGWQGLFEPKKTHNHFPEKRQQVDNKALAKQIYAQMQQRNNGGVENDG